MSATQKQPSSSEASPDGLRDRRSSKRVDIALTGRYMTPNQQDHGMTTRNVSCAGALITSIHQPEVGDRVVCYIDGLGRVDAVVSRLTDDGFAATFRTTQHKRDKLADKIIWLANKDQLGLAEERGAKRYTSTSGPVLLTRENGRKIQCRVIDISLTGAGLETDGPVPFVGETVTSSNFRGEVVRCHENTFGIRFLHAFQKEEDLPGRVEF